MAKWWRRLFGGGGEQTSDAPASRPALPSPALPARAAPARPARASGALQQLATRLDVTPRRLAFVLWHDPAPYHTITIPKRDGRVRLIHAPSSARKHVQRQILRNVLERHDKSPVSHGFRKRRSTFTGAHFHRKQPLVIRIDLEDFFPTIHAGRVGGVFKSLGFSGSVLRLLVKLCTHDGRLPQGAPTSPAIANLVCRKLDRRLWHLAKRQGCRFTRYADDMTLSGDMSTRKLLPLVRTILKEEGFQIAEKKTRLMRYGRRQEVTGLVVNSRVSVPRERRRWIRAIVHNAKRTGLAAQNRSSYPRFREYLKGNAEYIKRTHREQGQRLLAEIAKLRD